MFFILIFSREMVPVEKNRSGSKIFAMNQFRRIFNSCREPGIEKDTLRNYFQTGPCLSHGHTIATTTCRPAPNSRQLPEVDECLLIDCQRIYTATTTCRPVTNSRRLSEVGECSPLIVREFIQRQPLSDLRQIPCVN